MLHKWFVGRKGSKSCRKYAPHSHWFPIHSIWLLQNWIRMHFISNAAHRAVRGGKKRGKKMVIVHRIVLRLMSGVGYQKGPEEQSGFHHWEREPLRLCLDLELNLPLIDKGFCHWGDQNRSRGRLERWPFLQTYTSQAFMVERSLLRKTHDSLTWLNGI